MLPFPVIVLLIVFFIIAVRQIGSYRFQIWEAMVLGALAVLIHRDITLSKAIMSINFDVILFLFGMFVVGEAMEESGYLSDLSYKLFRTSKTANSLLLHILFRIGILSAILMNDTLAIVGTPVILHLSRQHKISSNVLLLALAFAVTIGSVMSPIGNPQNLLIALHGGIKNPFITFFNYLFIPTMVNLLLTYLILTSFYREHFHNNELNHIQAEIKDRRLAVISRISLYIIIILVAIKILFVLLNAGVDFKLTYIAIAGAIPVILFSNRRFEILKKIDWHTLLFFTAMFILMQSVWDTGFFQSLINRNGIDITSTESILIISVILSQFISNVPLVALYIPLLQHAGVNTKELMALVAGSTIAGNLTILGAASNVIIIQNSEERSGDTITFMRFFLIGLPLTILNLLVYWLYFKLF